METVSQQQSSAEVAKKNVFTIDIDEYIGHYFGQVHSKFKISKFVLLILDLCRRYTHNVASGIPFCRPTIVL